MSQLLEELCECAKSPALFWFWFYFYFSFYSPCSCREKLKSHECWKAKFKLKYIVYKYTRIYLYTHTHMYTYHFMVWQWIFQNPRAWQYCDHQWPGMAFGDKNTYGYLAEYKGTTSHKRDSNKFLASRNWHGSTEFQRSAAGSWTISRNQGK